MQKPARERGVTSNAAACMKKPARGEGDTLNVEQIALTPCGLSQRGLIQIRTLRRHVAGLAEGLDDEACCGADDIPRSRSTGGTRRVRIAVAIIISRHGNVSRLAPVDHIEPASPSDWEGR